METPATLLRYISIVLCLIIVASFVMFVWDEAGTASKNQAAIALNDPLAEIKRDEHGRLIKPAPAGSTAATSEPSEIRRTIDGINDTVTAPGEMVGENAGGNAWVMRSAALIFGLLLFGLGLSMLANWLGMDKQAYKVPERPRETDDFTPGGR
jgi:hypothetical protein